jgi:hypothetical protein
LNSRSTRSLIAASFGVCLTMNSRTMPTRNPASGLAFGCTLARM